MNTLRINDSPPAGRYGRRNLPVPAEQAAAPTDEERPVIRSGTREHASARPGGRPLLRATAPFLAQLSVQYDGIEALRRARRERYEQAAESYSDALARSPAAITGVRQDCKS